jgi:hypothetical protein
MIRQRANSSWYKALKYFLLLIDKIIPQLGPRRPLWGIRVVIIRKEDIYLLSVIVSAVTGIRVESLDIPAPG